MPSKDWYPHYLSFNIIISKNFNEYSIRAFHIIFVFKQEFKVFFIIKGVILAKT